MSLLVTGVDHHTAPVDLRERLSVERDDLPNTLQQLSEFVPQSAILSTCNRTEVYAYDPHVPELGKRVDDFISKYSGVPRPELERHTYKKWDVDCVSHLFRVAAGLESMIDGERQILGQVRAAFSAAGQGGFMKSPLTRVFHSALRTGRRVHRETSIGQHSRSVSHAAIQTAEGIFGSLEDRRALVVGAGDAGRMVARALSDAGVRHIKVTNRTSWRAEEVAKELGGVSVPFQDLASALAESDLVISSTGSPGYVVGYSMVSQSLTHRDVSDPLLMIDIAVPRDIDPAVADLGPVRLLDIDTLGEVAESNLDGATGEVRRANGIVEAELGKFIKWWNSSDTMELAIAIRRRAEALRRKEVAHTLRLLGEDEESELAARLDAMTNALVKKLLHQPTSELRTGDSKTLFPVASRMFGDNPSSRGRRGPR